MALSKNEAQMLVNHLQLVFKDGLEKSPIVFNYRKDHKGERRYLIVVRPYIYLSPDLIDAIYQSAVACLGRFIEKCDVDMINHTPRHLRRTVKIKRRVNPNLTVGDDKLSYVPKVQSTSLSG